MKQSRSPDPCDPSADQGLSSLVDAALTLAAEQAWETLTLADLARVGGRPVEHLYDLGGRDSLLGAISRQLDLTMAQTISGPDAGVRDRLFDALMVRYDAREARRASYLSVQAYLDRDLGEKARGLALNLRTARWALSLAGVEGRFADAASLPLARLIRRVDAAWVAETTADLGRVMATLDRGLADMEDGLSQVKRWTRGLWRPGRASTGNANGGTDQTD